MQTSDVKLTEFEKDVTCFLFAKSGHATSAIFSLQQVRRSFPRIDHDAFWLGCAGRTKKEVPAPASLCADDQLAWELTGPSDSNGAERNASRCHQAFSICFSQLSRIYASDRIWNCAGDSRRLLTMPISHALPNNFFACSECRHHPRRYPFASRRKRQGRLVG